MNKIKVELTNAQIDVINNTLSILTTSAMPLREVKLIRSVLLPFYQRLLKKRINDHHDNKKFKINLHYYEAHYLEEFLSFSEVFLTNDFERNTVSIVRSYLNQKLA